MDSNKDRVTKNKYLVYGLCIESEIVIPELLKAKDEKPADVNISYGTMSDYVHRKIQNGQTHELTKNEMWFSVENIATYYIKDGSSIMVEPKPDGNKHHIKAFLLGTAFGMLLIQRNIIAIHGSSIVVDGQGIIITGDSGAGKSTLTAAFRDEGYSFLSDDVSATAKDNNGNIIINPGYPQQKLCKDTMRKLGYDFEKYTMIEDIREKYAIPVHKAFLEKPVQLGAIIELTIGDLENTQIMKITGSEKLQILLKNIYRIEATEYAGMTSIYFRNCLDIANRVPLYRITRPEGIFTVEQQIGLIVKEIESNCRQVV